MNRGDNGAVSQSLQDFSFNNCSLINFKTRSNVMIIIEMYHISWNTSTSRIKSDCFQKKAWAVVIMIMDTTAANTKDIKTKKWTINSGQAYDNHHWKVRYQCNVVQRSKLWNRLDMFFSFRCCQQSNYVYCNLLACCSDSAMRRSPRHQETDGEG